MRMSTKKIVLKWGNFGAIKKLLIKKWSKQNSKSDKLYIYNKDNYWVSLSTSGFVSHLHQKIQKAYLRKNYSIRRPQVSCMAIKTKRDKLSLQFEKIEERNIFKEKRRKGHF